MEKSLTILPSTFKHSHITFLNALKKEIPSYYQNTPVELFWYYVMYNKPTITVSHWMFTMHT